MSKVAIEGNVSGTGTLTIAAPNTNSNFTLTIPDATGTLVASGTIPSLNGITFPATQVASADANTLDDYEEGTWTPDIGGNATYGTRQGNYTKIGNRVMLTGRLNVATRGTGSQSVVSGLPFTDPNIGMGQMGAVGFFTTSAQSVVNICPVIEEGTTNVRFFTLTAAGTASLNAQNVIQDGTIIDFSITYRV